MQFLVFLTRTRCPQGYHLPQCFPVSRSEEMVRIISGTIDVLPRRSIHSAAWSFKPIVYWMRFLGLDLNVGQERSSLHRLGFFIVGVAILVFNITSFIFSRSGFIQLFQNITYSSNGVLSIDEMRIMTKDVIFIVIQICIFELLHFKWRLVWKKVDEMEQQTHSPSSFYFRLRKLAIALVLTVIILVGSNVSKQIVLRPPPSGNFCFVSSFH